MLSRSVFATRETVLPVIASVAGLVTIIGVTVTAAPAARAWWPCRSAFAAGMAVRLAILAVALRHRIRAMSTAAE